MKIQICFLLAATFAVAVAASPANAAMPGQPCKKVGVTKVSDNQQDMVACLYDSSHHLIWKSLIQPAAETVAPVVVTPVAAAAPVAAATPVADAVPLAQEQRDHMSPSHMYWKGWYAGVNAGLADTTNSYNLTEGFTTDLQGYGGTVGLVGGYNWVRNNGLFYGGEADFNYVSNSERQSYDAVKSTWNGYATARGRVGVVLDPAVIFFTGGVALVDVRDKWFSYDDNGPSGPPVHFSLPTSPIHVGWTAGAGTEFALTDKISMSAQYLRLQMPESYGVATDPLHPEYPVYHYKFILDDSANILRLGLNYHFN